MDDVESSSVTDTLRMARFYARTILGSQLCCAFGYRMGNDSNQPAVQYPAHAVSVLCGLLPLHHLLHTIHELFCRYLLGIGGMHDILHVDSVHSVQRASQQPSYFPYIRHS